MGADGARAQQTWHLWDGQVPQPSEPSGPPEQGAHVSLGLSDSGRAGPGRWLQGWVGDPGLAHRVLRHRWWVSWVVRVGGGLSRWELCGGGLPEDTAAGKAELGAGRKGSSRLSQLRLPSQSTVGWVAQTTHGYLFNSFVT